MFDRVLVLAAVSLGLTLVACSSTPPANPEEHHVVRDTITGSNIPRKESNAKAGISSVERDSVQDVIRPQSPRGKPGG